MREVRLLDPVRWRSHALATAHAFGTPLEIMAFPATGPAETMKSTS